MRNSSSEKSDLAIADYSKSIELDPKYAEAYFSRAEVYQKTGKRDLAIADCNMVLKVTTDSVLTQDAQQLLKELQEN